MRNQVKTTGQKQNATVVSKIKTTPQYIIRKKQILQVMADDIVNRFNGVNAVNITELIDTNGKIVASDEQIKAIGCTIATIQIERDGVDFMCARHRETKEDNPYIKTRKGMATKTATERYTIQVLLNCIWQNVVDNRRDKTDGIDTKWEQGKGKINGICAYRDSRVVHTNKDNDMYYINYIIHRFLTGRVVTDENGDIIPNDILDAFAKQTKEQKQKSRAKEAIKHGIAVEFDPQYRNIKIANIKSIKMLGIEYQPIKCIEYQPIK